ncbi:MAG: hypothetical protein ACKOA2_00035 [Ilumatobacteraceae bacterium]
MARLRTPLARAVVPVLGGIGFFAVLGAGMWGVAALIADNSDRASDLLVPTYQELGRVDTISEVIADDGPIVLADLIGDDRNIVLDHTGPDPALGWAIYLAHPADRTAACPVEVVRGTRGFTDCDGRTLDVSELALPPLGVRPIVSADGVLTLDLVADDAEGTTSG